MAYLRLACLAAASCAAAVVTAQHPIPNVTNSLCYNSTDYQADAKGTSTPSRCAAALEPTSPALGRWVAVATCIAHCSVASCSPASLACAQLAKVYLRSALGPLALLLHNHTPHVHRCAAAAAATGTP